MLEAVRKKLKDNAFDLDAFIVEDLPFDAYYTVEEQIPEVGGALPGYSGFPWWHPFFILWYPMPTVPVPLPTRLTRVRSHSGRRSKVSRRGVRKVFGLESLVPSAKLSLVQQEDALILMGKL